MRAHVLTLALALLPAGAAAAEPTVKATPTPAVSRRDLLTAAIAPELPVGRVEVKEVTLPPRQRSPLHLHPCAVVGLVTAGEIAYQLEGQPVRHLRIGDAFYEPAGARVARFDAEGETEARFTAFYLLGKDEHELIRLLSQ